MQVKMESDSVEAVKSFVTVGLGISFLPLGAVAAEIESGVLRRVQVTGLPPLKRNTAVVYRTDRYLSAGARAFLKILSDDSELFPPLRLTQAARGTTAKLSNVVSVVAQS